MKAEQQAFVDALLGRGAAPATLTGGERGLAAYRGNLQALSAQALAVPFQRLREELGDQDFASLAWTFWRQHPPEGGDLGQWGGALEGFLVERAGEASGLPDLARLDWALHQAERAADVELDAASLNLLGTNACNCCCAPGWQSWRSSRGRWSSTGAAGAAHGRHCPPARLSSSPPCCVE
jgi:hypothetical protein